MSDRDTLREFTSEVIWNIGTLNIPLDVVDNSGETPVVPALEDEHLGTVMRRVMMLAGGYANVFVRGTNHVRQVSFIPSDSAIYAGDADDMTSEPPSGIVTIGAFLDYLETQPHGVNLPALLPIPTGARVSNVRPVEFAAA
ncbi:MAG: hypothetical protein ACK5LO_15040 [Leucobacter sp.]